MLAIDRQSLWLDELGTWRLTVAPTWSAWLGQLTAQTGTNVQLPLYHAFMRLWVALVPHGEWWLRASNLPWLLLAFYALLRCPVSPAARPLAFTTAAVLFVHPLVWYYANEARPYAMLFAGASMAGSGLLPMLLDDRDASRGARAERMLWAGLAVMACASPIGLLWAIGFAAPAWALGGFRPAHRAGAWRLVCGALLLMAAAWDLVTAVRGLRVTSAPGSSAAGFGFGLYEVAGALGIGPGRDALRDAGVGALKPYAVPVAVFGLGAAFAVIAGMRRLAGLAGRRATVTLTVALIPLVILAILAAATHSRIVGRHLLPLVWWFGCAIAALGRLPDRAPSRLALATAFALLAVSSLQIAFASRHEREDYRGATALALDHWRRGAVVWWVASPFGASYYGLERATSRDSGRTYVDLVDADSAALTRLPPPAFVALNRPEAFDARRAVARYLAAHGYRRIESPRGFAFWARDSLTAAASPRSRRSRRRASPRGATGRRRASPGHRDRT